jgi:histidinol-phosphate aminotransferase
MIDIEILVRDNIKKVKPYSSARDEYSGTANVFLDANENPYGSVVGSERNRYPDPYQNKLKKAISEYKNIPVDNIFLGNGSDEAIDLIFRIFCEPGKDKALIMPPTYGMYRVSASINDIETFEVLLKPDFQINIDRVLETATKEKVKLLFICSPNNPSANLFYDEDIRKILERFQGIVVIDEAYNDFSGHLSWYKKLAQYPNLVVFQTFSKAWGLAAIRLGMAFADKRIISYFNNIKPPYNVNNLTQELALEALNHIDKKESIVKQIISERDTLSKSLVEFDFITVIYPSDSNFILVKTTHAQELYDYLIGNNIVVRNRSKLPLCDECLRITVGTDEENKSLLRALKNFKY